MSDSVNKDVKFSVKAVINKEKNKVLFAEIDRHLADVLFSFLTFPLGQIVRVLEKHYGDKTPAIGSLSTLYGSLSNLDGGIFWAEGWKQVLLNPESSNFSDECRKLKLDIADTQPTKYFICRGYKCSGTKLAGMYHATVKCDCGEQITKEISLRIASKEPAADDGVFAVSTSSFILSDDFEILPNSTTSVRKIVTGLGLDVANGTECRDLTFGFDEITRLLLASLFFSSPLTCLILEEEMKEITVWFQTESIEISGYTCSVNVILQKSTTKLLFVEADEDFVDFLFSMLVIPLGKVESLLGGFTGLKNIDNLYKSITSSIDSKYLKEIERTKLINPTIPQGYVSRNCIFPLCEEMSPQLYYFPSDFLRREFLGRASNPLKEGNAEDFITHQLVTIQKCEDSYVRGPRKFMVKDDLTVAPLSTASYLSTINEQEIPFSDVAEVTLKIGLQEVSSILKASLSSTCALSKGLSHLLTKPPNQEKTVKQEQY